MRMRGIWLLILGGASQPDILQAFFLRLHTVIFRNEYLFSAIRVSFLPLRVLLIGGSFFSSILFPARLEKTVFVLLCSQTAQDREHITLIKILLSRSIELYARFQRGRKKMFELVFLILSHSEDCY